MNSYLLIDFGSTYTKLTLVDIDNQKIVATVSANTTVETNIKYGFESTMSKLKTKVDFSNVNIIDILACSSAGGGLKVVAIGVTPYYTVEAAKSASLGAGARLLKTFSYKLTQQNIIEIEDLSPDIILLTGGAEGGNKSYILHNAQMLTGLSAEIPIVVAGNKEANKEIATILNEGGKNHVITENVMPDTSRINSDPVREVIRQIFMQQIVMAKGMEDIEEIVSEILMPTPTAVLMAAELLAEGTEKYKGLTEVMVVDIGGATTDIHSVSKPVKAKGFIYEGLAEPYLKRTVEGDLGMRYSAISLYETVGKEGFLKYDGNLKDIHHKCKFRHDNPHVVFETEDEIEIDEIMAKNCVELSVKRHSGRVRESYLNGKKVLLQNGKDLSDITTIIGTGGVIINSKNPEEILNKVVVDDRSCLLPQNPYFLLDKRYILSAAGLLVMRDKDLAFKVLSDNLEAVG